ncbi:MAG: tetratricopeptide repeat protein [Treponema sp.]
MKSLYKIVWITAGISFVSGSVFCFSGHGSPSSPRLPDMSAGLVAVRSATPAQDPPDDAPLSRVDFGVQLQTLLNEQKWEDALTLFDLLAEEDRNTVAIQNLKIAILVSYGKVQEAEHAAKMLEKQHPRDLDVLYTLTMIAQAKDDKKMRTVYLKKILKIDPNNVQALQEEGMDFYSLGNYKEARERFGRILKQHPDNVQALIWLGKISYLDNKLKEAEDCYTAALRYEPDNSLAVAELARVKSETGRMAEAIGDIRRAIELEPDAAPHWTDLGSYNLQIGRKQEALDAFTHAAALVPDSYFVHIYLAGLHDDLGNKEAAIRHYTKITELYPQYYFAYEGLGVLLFEKKDWAGARYAFLSALEYAPANTYYALMATVCSYKTGKKTEAKNFMSKYIKTVDRTKHDTDYFLCRLFIDLAGDNDVNNRITKEKEETDRLRKYFYLAQFYKMTGKGHIAEKYLLDIKTVQAPAFFEYRLAVSELGADS